MRDFVILGASGNLARGKLFPALFVNYNEGCRCNYYGFGRTELTDLEFKSIVKDSVPSADEDFLNQFQYFSGDYDSRGLKVLRSELKDTGAIFYLAVPTRKDVVKNIISGLKKNDLLGEESTVVLEKPFGTDYQSAEKLIAFLEDNLGSKNTHLIDHYLAKDLIRNLITLRFANPIFGNLWNNNFVDRIEIEASESVGIEGRGGYYDKSGAIRDMIQNHVLQVLTLVVMDQPKKIDFASFSDQKTKVLKNLRMFDNQFQNNVEIGQYQGYLNEKGVSAGSLAETSAGLTVEIENQQWQGVPIKLKTGKKLAEKQTQIAVYFKGDDDCLWHEKCDLLTGNKLVVNLFPRGDIQLQVNTEFNPEKNLPKPKNLTFDFSENEEIKMPYANALKDIYHQDKLYTPSFKEILLSWKFIDQVENWLADKREKLLKIY